MNDPIKMLNALQQHELKPDPADVSRLRDAELMKKSKELESVFLTQMIKAMEKTVPEGMGGTKNTLSSMMFSSVMADAMSDGGGIGLSRMIFQSLKDQDGQAELPDGSTDDFLHSLNLLNNLPSMED